MFIRKSCEQDLHTVSTWFNSEKEVRIWGGPRIRYPLNIDQLKIDIDWSTSRSFVLVEDKELLGFAQIVDRYGNNHICRVAITPRKRGRGLGLIFMQLLLATENKDGRDYSLRVYAINKAAISLYEKLGFLVQPAPEKRHNSEESLYMIKKVP